MNLNYDVLGWALIHSFWQGAVIVGVLRLILLFVGGARASLRYGICCLALALMPLCLLATYNFLASQPARSLQTGSDPSHPDMLQVSVPGELVKTVASGELAEAGNPFLPAIVPVWLVCIAILTTRKAGGFYLVWRLETRNIAPVPEAWRDRFGQLCRKLRVTRALLKLSLRTTIPMTFGWLCPVVLFPASLLTSLSPEEVELLLAHELAHIRRHDYLANLLQTVVETLFFYHPAVWWISGQIRQERENACDDLLLLLEPNQALTYAKALLNLETARPSPSWLVAAATDGSLLQRIERILGKRTLPSLGAGAVLAMLFLVLVIGLSLQPAKSQSTPAIKPDPEVEEINTKLKSIIIPHVRFLKASIGEILDYLAKQSKQLDPSHKGLNFIIPTSIAEKPSQAFTGPDVSANFSVLRAGAWLEILCEEDDLQYTVHDGAIYIQPSNLPAPLVIKTFLVSHGFVERFFLKDPSVKSVDAKQKLIDFGITFPAGAGATLVPGSSELTIVNTPDEIEKASTLLDEFRHGIKINAVVVSVDNQTYQQNKATIDDAIKTGNTGVLSKLHDLDGIYPVQLKTYNTQRIEIGTVLPGSRLPQDDAIMVDAIPVISRDSISLKIDAKSGPWLKPLSKQRDSGALETELVLKDGETKGFWCDDVSKNNGALDLVEKEGRKIALIFTVNLISQSDDK